MVSFAHVLVKDLALYKRVFTHVCQPVLLLNSCCCYTLLSLKFNVLYVDYPYWGKVYCVHVHLTLLTPTLCSQVGMYHLPKLMLQNILHRYWMTVGQNLLQHICHLGPLLFDVHVFRHKDLFLTGIFHELKFTEVIFINFYCTWAKFINFDFNNNIFHNLSSYLSKFYEI